MPPRAQHPLTVRRVERLPAGSETTDPALPGFGVRVRKHNNRIRREYFIRWKDPRTSKRRRKTLGYHGETLTLERARTEACEALREIRAGRFLAGALKPVTVAALAERFLVEHARVRCRPTTVKSWESMLGNHIFPAIGGLAVDAVTQDDIRQLHAGIGRKTFRGRKTTGAANRALSLLHNMFNWAEAWGLREPNTNPARRGTRALVPFEERMLGRVLTVEERARLLSVIHAHAAVPAKRKGHIGPHYAALFETLLWCPARLGELLELRWPDVRFGDGGARLRVRISKTKAKSIPLPNQAVEVLTRHRERFGGRGRVFASAPGGRLQQVQRVWSKVRRWAELGETATEHAFRIHDFRHTLLSEIVEGGEPLYLASRACGHSRMVSTERYVHLRDPQVEQAMQRTADRIAASLNRG